MAYNRGIPPGRPPAARNVEPRAPFSPWRAEPPAPENFARMQPERRSPRARRERRDHSPPTWGEYELQTAPFLGAESHELSHQFSESRRHQQNKQGVAAALSLWLGIGQWYCT